MRLIYSSLFGEDDGLVDVPHAMAAQPFQGMEGLRALADDVADVLAGGQIVIVTPRTLIKVIRRIPVSVEAEYDVQEAYACGRGELISTD